MAAFTPYTRPQMAARLASDIPGGWYVNLGIGMPILVADYVEPAREVIFQSENGILGMGPTPPPDQIQPWLVNAGKQPITLLPGGCYFHHADSFAMIRGGHLDLCVLGGFQVSATGDLANWALSGDEKAPAVGGAMDLAVGAKRIWVLMEHTTKQGAPRLVRSCTYPLTAIGNVGRVYTNLAVLEINATGFTVLDMVPGMSLPELQNLTDAELRLGEIEHV